MQWKDPKEAPGAACLSTMVASASRSVLAWLPTEHLPLASVPSLTTLTGFGCGVGGAGVGEGMEGGFKNSVAKVEEIMRILTFKNFFLQCLIIFKCQRELEWLLTLSS